MNRHRLWAVAIAVALLGCSETDLSAIGGENSAVVTGDFDDISEPFDRLAVPYDRFDGVISVATWDPDYDPETQTRLAESLLRNRADIDRYRRVLIASGARGLGDTVYNGVDPDDALVSDPAVRDNVAFWVERGGILFVTDWAYDLVEAIWPGRLDLVGSDDVYDAAQTGLPATTTASVADERLVEELGASIVAIDHDFSNWAPVRAVADDVTVWLTGDVSYRMPGSEEVVELPGAPLLVSWPSGSGRVVYATFHVSAQTDAVADAIFREVLGPLPEGRSEVDFP